MAPSQRPSQEVCHPGGTLPQPAWLPLLLTEGTPLTRLPPGPSLQRPRPPLLPLPPGQLHLDPFPGSPAPTACSGLAPLPQLLGDWHIVRWAGDLPIPEEKKTHPLPPFKFVRNKLNKLEFRMTLM